MAKPDIYTRVTEKIIADLEAGMAARGAEGTHEATEEGTALAERWILRVDRHAKLTPVWSAPQGVDMIGVRPRGWT